MSDANAPLTGCPEEHCRFPSLPCVRGIDPANACPALRGAAPSAEPSPSRPHSDLPWSGAALGSADLSILTAFRRPRIVGLVGLENSGKTTVLATLYLLLGRGFELADRTFAGSVTLQGWEALASAMRLPPSGSGVGFPDHTTSTDRQPGLLHLAFRRSDGSREDVLFADAPGEWFREWADKTDSPTAAGARWLAQHADVFAVLTDSEALAGSDRGPYRAQQTRLIRRTGEAAAGRLVVAVWAKADVNVPGAIRGQLVQQIAHSLPDSPVVDNTARPTSWDPTSASRFLSLFEALLASAPALPKQLNVPVVRHNDPLLAFRGSPDSR